MSPTLPAEHTSRPGEIEAAIETFVGGFTFTRSFTHPYLGEQVGPLWVMRDAPRRSGGCRNEEWVSHGVAPEEVDRIVRGHARGRFAVCALLAGGEADQPLRDGFRALSYRLRATEPLMVHDLAQIPELPAPVTVERVQSAELADRLKQAAGSRQILPRHFAGGAPLRQYAAVADDGAIAGWVRSIQVGEATWCSNMYVRPEYRRRGIAKTMLSRMLRDDRDHGARRAVLLSSHTGAMLYPVVGYRRIGTLFLYTPPRR